MIMIDDSHHNYKVSFKNEWQATQKNLLPDKRKGAHAHSSLLYADNQSFLTYVGVAEGVLRVR